MRTGSSRLHLTSTGPPSWAASLLFILVFQNSSLVQHDNHFRIKTGWMIRPEFHQVLTVAESVAMIADKHLVAGGLVAFGGRG